jgi:hypothetical protein
MNNEYYRISCKILQQISNSVSKSDGIFSHNRKEFKKENIQNSDQNSAAKIEF